MAQQLIATVLITTALATTQFLPAHESAPVKTGAIGAGAGYSSDTTQIAPQGCYKTSVGSTTAGSAQMKFSQASTFTDLQNDLHVDVGLKVGYEMFSASAETSYMRSMEDKSYSMSLNYYSYYSNKVAVNVEAFGTDALTDVGSSLYNNGNNPYFGIICGDNYVSSYNEGALLTMGLNLVFDTSIQKKAFGEKFGISFGSLISLTASIKTFVENEKIGGSISMQAFQKGGDPTKLGNILTTDASGGYFVLTCSFSDMDACTSAAGGMLDYAQKDFQTQFSLTNATNLEPLGLGFTEYLPIEYFGLTMPKSLVDADVTANRASLGAMLKENQFYANMIGQFVDAYPGHWQEGSSLLNSLKKSYNQAKTNIAVLMSPGNPQSGAAGCWDTPNQCASLYSSISSTIKTIVYEDLTWLPEVQYTIDTVAGTLYKIGDDATSWGCKDGDVTIKTMTFNSKTFDIDADITCEDQRGHDVPGEMEFSGTSTDGINYAGHLEVYCNGWKVQDEDHTYAKKTSPYFFYTYSTEAQESS